jgi:hypothetical protein
MEELLLDFVSGVCLGCDAVFGKCECEEVSFD